MSRELHQVFVGMGSNLGDRWKTLSAAIGILTRSPEFLDIETSSVYETDPVGEINQPAFLNLVASFKTSLRPEETLERLLEIEQSFGRVRDVRWGPRSLDLDLLFYEGQTRRTPRLTLPHPRMHERAFVIVPFRELLRLPRFHSGRWDELRAQLDNPISLDGVRSYHQG
jgi:2-amino-4-hydroxy-6-hydroxymethyldihydropteridine diphosphokinase